MIKEFAKSKKLKVFYDAVKSGDPILVEELWDAPKAILASMVQDATKKRVFIITGRAKEENRLFDDLSMFFDGVVDDFPAWETLPSEKIPPSPDIIGQRFHILKNLLEDGSKKIVVSSLQASLQKLLPPKKFASLCLKLSVKEEFSFEKLISKLVEMGYEKKGLVTDKAEFAVRGGLIDVFPVGMPEPYRIEFWGDEIDSIRTFDPVGQVSVDEVTVVEITPGKEMELLQEEENPASVLDYLGEDAVIIFDNILAIEDRCISLEGLPGAITKTFPTFHEFFKTTKAYQKIYWSETDIEAMCDVRVLDERGSDVYVTDSPIHDVAFEVFDRDLKAKRWFHPFQKIRDYFCPMEALSGNMFGEDLLSAITSRTNVTGVDLIKAVDKISKAPMHLKFLCSTESDERHLQEQFQTFDVAVPKKTEYVRGYLSSGFVLEDINEILFPLTEITRRYKIRRQKLRSQFHTAPSDMFDLAPGDYIVHLHAGIGRFVGIERQKNIHGIEQEFFLIEYAENAKLYLPFTHAHLISKFVGTKEEAKPRLHALGGNRWKKTRRNTEKAIMGYASDLLHLYAQRQTLTGFSYGGDSEMLLRFEDDFPYDETEDQVSAVLDVKKNMADEKPMDRLVCGDVGYGKTEVAMRAAFKAVVDGCKQVAVLVPTTVLAMQHYETFVERMWNFPIKVGVLSRFRSQKEIKLTLEEAQKG